MYKTGVTIVFNPCLFICYRRYSPKDCTGNPVISFVMSCAASILLMFVGPACAETGVSRDWTWNTDQADVYFAITTNSEEQILGQYCHIENGACFYVVSLDIFCEPGSTYPALVNSDKGADHIVLKCVHGYKSQNILAIYAFNKIDELVRAASHIGIVVPVENDEFEIIEFSLIGSSYAIDHMRNAAKKAFEAVPENKKFPTKEVI